MSEPIDRLYGGASDAGTDMVKLLSFDSAVMAARGVHDHLMATHELITGMARDIDVPEAELQGSAAGALKDALTGIANEFEDLAVQMTTPREFTGEIDRARSQLRDSTMALSRAYETWRNSPGAWPAQRVIHLFHQTFDPFVGRAAQTVSGAAGPVIQTPSARPPTRASGTVWRTAPSRTGRPAWWTTWTPPRAPNCPPSTGRTARPPLSSRA